MPDERERRSGSGREIPLPKVDPGSRATDDHAAATASRGAHQPTEGLDEGVDDEHLSSSSQGVRPESAPDRG